MERMEHFRGGKLLDGEQVVLDGVDGHLSCRERAHGRKEWHGFFELSSDQHIAAGAHYFLVLPDGRRAEIYAEDVQGPCNSSQKHAAMFYVIGDIQGRGRVGLSGSGLWPRY